MQFKEFTSLQETFREGPFPETGCVLGPFAAMPAPGQTSLPTTDTRKQEGTRSNLVHVRMGQIVYKILKDPKPDCHF